eukprot:scaffold94506_cov51-Phaeocystis_antarctica.AAC.1
MSSSRPKPVMAVAAMGLVPMLPSTEVLPVLVMPALVSRQKSTAVPRLTTARTGLGGGGLNTLRAFVLSSAASTVEPVARSNGSHCGGHATGCSASTNLLATLGLVTCGMTAAQKAAAMPMRTSVGKCVACFLVCRLRRRSPGE